MEQIAQPAKEFHLDTVFARHQLVQRAIPLLDPVQVYPYATLLLPGSQNPLAITSTDKIALQPLRQRMLAARTAETIGHQHQHSIRQRQSAGLLHTVCFWRQAIQNALQAQIAPQPARHQHRYPAGGKSRFNALGAGGRTRLAAAQQLNETLKVRRQEILASQIGDDALFGTAVLPISLHQADVFELDPLGAFSSDRA